MILITRRIDRGAPEQRYETDGRDVTIGRGAECDWTLADPTRLLSKRHCRVTRADGAWRVIDLSSNGMTVNGQSIQAGLALPLREGDRLGLGAYEVTVSNVDTAAGFGTGAPPSRDEAPFGSGLDGGRLLGDPFVSPLDADIVDAFDVGLPPLFGEAEQPGQRFSSVATPLGASEGDGVSDLASPFVPPRPMGALLPEDWLSELGTAGPGPVDPHAATQAIPDWEPPDLLPAPSADASREEVAAPLPAPVAPPGRAEPATVPTPPAAAAAPIADGAGMEGALAAFVRGAGLEGSPRLPPEQALEEFGRAFRAAVAGLRRMMIARAVIKGEFRIDRTMIRPFGNNPLKFATDDADAMSAVLGIGRQAGMTAEQAINDSFRDVSSHEMAVAKAMQAGVAHLLEELSPEAIERETSPGALDAMPGRRRGRAWQAYIARHARVTAGLANNLEGAFGQAFARAYELAVAEAEGKGGAGKGGGSGGAA